MCLVSCQNCGSPVWAWGSQPPMKGDSLTHPPAFLHGHLPPPALATGILSSWLGLARQLGQGLSPREGKRQVGAGWREKKEADSSGWWKFFGSQRDPGSHPSYSPSRPIPRWVGTPAGGQDSLKTLGTVLDHLQISVTSSVMGASLAYIPEARGRGSTSHAAGLFAEESRVCRELHWLWAQLPTFRTAYLDLV